MRNSYSVNRHVRLYAWWRSAAARLYPILLLAMVGCPDYPSTEERLNDRITYTFYDPAADFQRLPTFTISEEVVVFREADDGSLARELLPATIASMLVGRVVQQMQSRGFVRVGRNDAPALGLSLSVLSGTVSGYYYGYWGSYWGYYGWYYAYPYVATYDYETGTLAIEATDLLKAGAPDTTPPGDAGPAPAQQLNVVWGSLSYGVLFESEAANVQSALESIDQSFEQSPYLRTGGGTP